MANDFILVLDLGGPQAERMARKLRNQHYYAEIISRKADIGLFRRKSPRGILIAGGEDGVGTFPRAVLALGIPVLAMGGAARMLAAAEGARSEGILLQESAAQIRFEPCPLFDGLSDSDRYFTRVDGFVLPESYRPIATTMDGLVPAFADFDRSLYALQFYAESNDPDGAVMLSNFAEKICGCTPVWTLENYIDDELRFIRERVGDRRAVVAVSGGVDSATCALLMRRAIGDALTCVLVDNGLLRMDEADHVVETYKTELGLDVVRIDAAERFLSRLKGLSDPVEKHRAAHDAFIETLSEYARAQRGEPYLVKGTTYSDLLASGASDEAYARTFDAGHVLEPVRMLFKEEVREVGAALGLPEAISSRRSFPAPGLALRCCGEVTAEKLSALRRADRIMRDVIREADQNKRLTQYFAVMTDTRALASGGYGWVVALRAVSEQGARFTVGKLPYDVLDRATERILTEVPGVARVVYDISGSACDAVEWE